MKRRAIAVLLAVMLLASGLSFSCSRSVGMSAREMAINSATEFCNRQLLDVSFEDEGCGSDSNLASRYVVSLDGRRDHTTDEVMSDYERILEIVERYKNETLAKEYYASLDWSDVKSSSWDIEENAPLDSPVYGNESKLWNTANQERLELCEYVLVFRESCVVVELTVEPNWDKIEDEMAITGTPMIYYNYLRMGLQRAIAFADVAEAMVVVT